MDYEVLRGAAGTVARTRPFLYLEAKQGKNTQQAIAWLKERSYHCYWHMAWFYSADNYRAVADNILPPGLGDINLLALPAEKGIQVHLPVIHHAGADWQQDYEAFLARSGKNNPV
jgi:hypothetical protein